MLSKKHFLVNHVWKRLFLKPIYFKPNKLYIFFEDFPGSFMCLWKPPRRWFIVCFPNILDYFVFEVRHRIGFDGT